MFTAVGSYRRARKGNRRAIASIVRIFPMCKAGPRRLSMPKQATDLSAADDDNHECSRLGSWPAIRCCGWFKFSGGQVERVCRLVQTHRACPKRRLDDLFNAECTAMLADHGKRAFTAAGESLPIVKLVGIDARADRKRTKHLAVVGIHDDHVLRLACADEDAMMRCVNGHARGMASGCGGPAC